MKSFFYALVVTLTGMPLYADSRLSRAEYQDRIHAAWTAQILGTLMGFEFEHSRPLRFLSTSSRTAFRSRPSMTTTTTNWSPSGRLRNTASE